LWGDLDLGNTTNRRKKFLRGNNICQDYNYLYHCNWRLIKQNNKRKTTTTTTTATTTTTKTSH